MPELEKTIRKEAGRARRNAMELATFRALRLNQPVDEVVESVLIEAPTWRGIETPEPLERRGAWILGPVDIQISTSTPSALSNRSAVGDTRQ